MSAPSPFDQTDLSVALICHPASPCACVERIGVNVRVSGARLLLRYRIEGDMDHVRVPKTSTTKRADNLWRHTCVEAFIRAAAQDGYVELNFSPSGEWAAYRFKSYREGMANIEMAAPHIDMLGDARILDVTADVDLQALFDAPAHSKLQLALATVIEQADGTVSYWAAAHPGGKPDFHHTNGFVTSIER